MQYRVDLYNIVWDTDGVDIAECNLPISLDFFVEAPEGLTRATELHDHVLQSLHDQYNFNVISFSIRSMRSRNRPVVLPEPMMDPDALRSMQWGTHPQHVEAVQQVGRQLRVAPPEPNASVCDISINGELTLQGSPRVRATRGDDGRVTIEVDSEDEVSARARATPPAIPDRASLRRMLHEAASHYGPAAISGALGLAARGNDMVTSPPTGGPPWVVNPRQARATTPRPQAAPFRPPSGNPNIDAELADFLRLMEASGIPAADTTELLEAQRRELTERQRNSQASQTAPNAAGQVTPATPASQQLQQAAATQPGPNPRSAFERAVASFGAGAVGAGTAGSSYGSPPHPGAASFQTLQSVSRVGPWPNLAGVTMGTIVGFFSNLFNVFAVGTRPCCPICASFSTEFTCTVVMSDEDTSVQVVCGVCGLKSIPRENTYELHYGDKTVSAEYSCLVTTPGQQFVQFCEEIFRWRAAYRSGGKKKPRQSVILNPAEDEADENPV